MAPFWCFIFIGHGSVIGGPMQNKNQNENLM